MSEIKPIRRLLLHHAFNIRDLGGYPISDSTYTSWNKCYRADNLSALDEHDWIILQQANVGLIIDLRSNQECNSAPYDATSYGIRVRKISFMKEEIKDMNSIDEDAKKQFLQSMKLDYVQSLQEASAPLIEALEEIARTFKEGKAVLFHCSAGKDRTGMLACVLLDLCGVSENDILADYQVSHTYNQAGLNKLIPKELLENATIRALLGSDIETLKPLLAFLHQTSTEEYLKHLGLQQETITILQQTLTTSI
ncbi:MAG: tyrosine-protein phosphatase [Longicatena sp.]